MSPALARGARAGGWTILFGVALAYAIAAALGVAGLDAFPVRLVADGVVCAAAGICLTRGVVRRADRRAWLALGLAVASWAIGDLVYSLSLLSDAEPPVPAPSDALWLAFYPLGCLGILLLARRRIGRIRATLVLDGLIAGITVAAVGIAVAGRPILAAPEGGFWLLATLLAYPIADMVLLAIVVGVAAATAWRPGAGWSMVAAGLAACAVADGYFAYLAATREFIAGTILDGLWPLAAVMIALAAWRIAPVQVAREPAGWPTLVLPCAFAAAALVIVAADRLWPVPTLAWALAIVALVGAIARAGLSFAENQRISAARRRDALTDALTGLGNRRRLVEDLERILSGEVTGRGALLMLDLDGFKAYNDTYGHLAGDGLLARLGAKLADIAGPPRRAYRLGGDEFCVLVEPCRADELLALGVAAEAALSHAEGSVTVGCSWGTVRLPEEAATVKAALQLADERLYHRKASRLRSTAGLQARDALMRALAEREPDLAAHVGTTTNLSLALARRLGVPETEFDTIAMAAQLHDVGKLACPDSILEKPGPLDDLEWVLMRQHTLIGERIIAAAPALGPVARLVRASHEWWDGSGYPDGLVGRAIPLGARIIAVCDAFDAMTSPRPYDSARTQGAALAELDRCAGSQFDPEVVGALRIEVTERASRITSLTRPSGSRTGRA